MVGENKNVLVEFDYENIILVDPNKVIDSEGKVGERFLPPENLVCFANLECNLFPRTRLASGSQGATAEVVNIASINFLKPGGESLLKNEFYDEFTGENSRSGQGLNQPSEKGQKVSGADKSTEYYFQQQTINNVDTGLLGITSIIVENQNIGQPEVQIELVDIRGRALFEKGENSPYAAFFNLPYPIFYLTIKGYIGQAVKYQLTLTSFAARFDTTTGNYNISLRMSAFKYNILNSLMLGNVLAVPYMYNKKYQVSPTIAAGATPLTNDVITINESKGLQKIKEVYSEYKAKNLIPNTFPELTVKQLMNKLEFMERYVLESFGKQDLSSQTEVKNFREILRQYEGEVVAYTGEDSWFGKYCTKNEFWVTTKGLKVYKLKPNYAVGGGILESLQSLDTVLKKFQDQMMKNPTFGLLPGNVIVNNKIISTRIVNPAEQVNYEKFLRIVTDSDIDFPETYRQRYSKEPTQITISKLQLEFNSVSINQLKSEVQGLITGGGGTSTQSQQDQASQEAPKPGESGQKKDITIELEKYGVKTTSIVTYQIDGDNSFDTYIKGLNAKVDEKKKEIDDALNKALEEKIQSSDTGLGFEPTLVNVIAVIMASAEAFIRLMEDVHESAWNQRSNKYRLEAVLGTDTAAPSPDAKDSVQEGGTNLIPVYPWPHYFVETNTEKGERFEMRYPGDPAVSNKTKGYIYAYWPEVEFVEEYLKGRMLIDKPLEIPVPQGDDSKVINRASFNAIDYPLTNLVFANKEEVKFFYEIYERFILPFYYQRFNRGDFMKAQGYSCVGDAEFLNLQQSLAGGSPYLTQKLKQYNLSSTIYVPFLANISNNGIGESWQKFIRGIFNTPYLQNRVSDSFVIESFESFDSSVITKVPPSQQIMVDYLGAEYTSNTDLLDVFPQAINSFYSSSLAYGEGQTFESSWKTNSVLKLYQSKNLVTNFTPDTKAYQNRPFTSYKFVTATIPKQPVLTTFNTFYDSPVDERELYPTQGKLVYKDYQGKLSPQQNTSIFNTPYFVNAISKGVNNWLSGEKTPFVAAAYLFLNSLPISNVSEKYTSFENNFTNYSDYIFATLKKYGGVHRLPYAFILKIGSVWNRYKTFIDTGVDFLDDVWKDFDAVSSFDPITNDPARNYVFSINNVPQSIQLQTNKSLSGVSTECINVGFYPKLINDISLFVNGTTIFQTFTDTEINEKIQNGDINVIPLVGTNLNKTKTHDTTHPNTALQYRGWACTVTDKINGKQYLVPSLGSNFSQVDYDCFGKTPIASIPVIGNPAIFNGSVRMFWSSSQFGYFDNSSLSKPTPLQYMKRIYRAQENQMAFNFTDYSSIEDLFGVFSKQDLDEMENHFLNFSKSQYEFAILKNENNVIVRETINKLQNTPDASLQNFQLLMKNLFGLQPSSSPEPITLLKTLMLKQDAQLLPELNKFLLYDKLLKIGNPGQFDKKLFYSLAQTTEFYIEEPYTFNLYTPGSLPSSLGSPSLQQSQEQNPNAWKALQTYVGFSTIPNMDYTNSGSFITDFFIDLNIEFSEDNVILLAPLIKIYATQKYNKVAPPTPALQTAPIVPPTITDITQNTPSNIVAKSTLKDGSEITITKSGSRRKAQMRNALGILEYDGQFVSSEITIKQLVDESIISVYGNTSNDPENPQYVVDTNQYNQTNTPQTLSQQQTPPSVSGIGPEFLNNIRSYLRTTKLNMDISLDYFFNKVRNQLPNVSEVNEDTNKVGYEGEQMKLELYDGFKGVNDTWIAGSDFSETTLFEDFLFLDRANRNIGDKIIINPFKLKNRFDSINMSGSVYTFVASILAEHHLYHMIVPGYINFYNAEEIADQTTPKVDGTLEFGNNLFGTFLSVDTRKTRTKFLCYYQDGQSKYLDMGNNKDYKYNSDSFELRRSSDNPLLETLNGKVDYARSNRVVGFNVDIGIRNQNIFTKFDISQNAAKLTLEAAQHLDNVVSQASGKKYTTQNTSLWNFYKSRNYECSVECIGNAVIQPLMYFNLRHVPMFNGTYMIMSVKHTITPGNFTTRFTGSRQSMFVFPKIDSYIQGAVREILDEVLELRKQESTENGGSINTVTTTTTINAQSSSVAPITSQPIGETTPQNSCKPTNQKYQLFEPTNAVQGAALSITSVKTAIEGTGSANRAAKWMMFLTAYLTSYKNSEFLYFNNNIGNADLLGDWGPLITSLQKTYFCQKGSDGKSYPYAVFASIPTAFQMMNSKYKNIVLTLNLTNANEIDETSIDKSLEIYYVYWSQLDRMTPQSFSEFKTKNVDYYNNVKEIVKKAYLEAKAIGLI